MAVEKSVDARLLLASAALIAMHPDYAVAQEAQSGVQAPQNNGQMGDIVVTAQKRTERADKVPISISALSGQQLRDRHEDSLADLVSSIPNLQLSSNDGTSTPIFSLRGVSMADYSLNQDGPVATYYDGVYKGNPAFLGVGFLDVDRLEVLRGPQGTLYGKNTTGSAVNTLAQKPTDFTTKGYLSLGYGNYNRVEAAGAVQTAISDTLAVRAAFTFSCGYRAPFFNAQAFSNPAELSLAKEEKVAAYEVGFKSRLAGDHIRLSGAAFYYDYQNQQFIDYDASSDVQTLINLPKSRIYGGELEAQARPDPSPTLDASMGLLYSRVLRGSVTGVDVAGHQLINAPHLTLVGNADWVAAQGDWSSIKAHGDIYWLSGQYFEIFNEAALHQDSFAVLNGRIAYRNPSENVEFSVWMKNITNTPYYTARVDIS